MIVVAGGSGTLGRLVVANLLDRGEPVRVLVRDAARGRAVHGFLGGRGAGAAEVDDRGNANLIDAAAQVGADVVLVSVLGAAQNSPVDFFRAKHAAEQNVRRGRTPWTIVRAGPFLETWLPVLATTAGTSGRPLVFGRGDQPLPFVSALDVAAVVARAATDTTLRGSVLEIAGEPIAMTDLALALQQSRHWQGSPRHVPRAVLRALAVLARPLNPRFARQNRTALAMDTGQVAVPAAAVNPLGSPPRTVADVVAGSVLN